MLHNKALGLCFAFVMALGITNRCLAQSKPQDYLNAHNTARRAVGVGPVTWDKKLELYAQKYANERRVDCQLKHSGGPYGENLFAGWGKNYSGINAVNSWVKEKQYYNPRTCACVPGKECRHYTQVVWRSSTKIGCADIVCNDKGIFIICSYNPPGNVARQCPYEDIQLNSEV